MKRFAPLMIPTVCALAALCACSGTVSQELPDVQPRTAVLYAAEPENAPQDNGVVLAKPMIETDAGSLMPEEPRTQLGTETPETEDGDEPQEVVPIDPYAALGIPADADASVYTMECKARMLECGLDYEMVDVLINCGFDLEQIFSMSNEARRVRSFTYINPRFDGGLDALLEQLPQQAQSIAETYPEIVTKQQYGSSVQERSLDAYFLRNCDTPEQKIVLTFAIHGYEGLKANDGAYLTESAYQLMLFYCQNPEFLGKTELVICPILNPDGVYVPKKIRYGRTQYQGIDMNRDFGQGRFKAQESRAFRDLLLELKPDILIDFHGWLSGTYGDKTLAEIFKRHMGLRHTDSRYGSSQGYLIGYAYKQGIQSLLVEHPHYDEIDIAGMIFAVNELCRDET